MLNKISLNSKKIKQYLGNNIINIKDIDNVEKATDVKLSSEFRELYSALPYTFIGSTTSWSFPTGVIEETLSLRKTRHLPLDTLCISEESESVIFMKCLGDHEEIYWLSYADAHNYCENKTLEDNPVIFPTFADFFAYLLDEEEKLRAEESK
jgi:hypothetical protein